MNSIKRSATLSLITVICAAYLIQQIDSGLQSTLLLPNIEYLQASGQWYRLFTVALTHGGLLHLGFNMYGLLVLGNPIEAAFGKAKFLAIFFISLLAGSLTSAYFAPFYSFSVGASGAVFGLFGALIIVGKRIGANTRELIVVVGLNFAFGFIASGIDWRAHLGGLIGGALAARFTLKNRYYR